MWQFVIATEEYPRRQKQLGKDGPRELAAVLVNLDRYREALDQGTPPKQIQANWIHPEPMDIVALTEKGGSRATGGKKQKGLRPTRLYVYPERDRELLHLLTLGDKSTQHDDIQFAKSCVEQLIRQREQEARDDQDIP